MKHYLWISPGPFPERNGGPSHRNPETAVVTIARLRARVAIRDVMLYIVVRGLWVPVLRIIGAHGTEQSNNCMSVRSRQRQSMATLNSTGTRPKLRLRGIKSILSHKFEETVPEKSGNSRPGSDEVDDRNPLASNNLGLPFSETREKYPPQNLRIFFVSSNGLFVPPEIS